MATTAQLSENSHPGFEGIKAALCLAEIDANSNPASGMQPCLRRKGTGSRCSGKERDNESGLDYFEARYFSGAQGRFTSADPFTVTPARVLDPQQLNLYAYVRNNPLKLVDPTGMLIDDSQLSDKDKKKWQAIMAIVNKVDSKGNFVNPELHKVFERLQSDERTFVIENAKLSQTVAGNFMLTEFSGNDFTKAKLQVDFRKVEGISSTTSADLVPGFNKFQGILDNKDLKLAEVFGHEGAHGVFALDNPAGAVALELLLKDRDTAMNGLRYPYPPDVMQKIKAASDGLIPTEKFAQQAEKLINGELQAKENRKK